MKSCGIESIAWIRYSMPMRSDSWALQSTVLSFMTIFGWEVAEEAPETRQAIQQARSTAEKIAEGIIKAQRDKLAC